MMNAQGARIPRGKEVRYKKVYKRKNIEISRLYQEHQVDAFSPVANIRVGGGITIRGAGTSPRRTMPGKVVKYRDE